MSSSSTATSNATQITRADQDAINKFSILTTKSIYHRDLLNGHKSKMDSFQEAFEELELVLDEDELISIQCGSGFIKMNVEDCRTLLRKRLEREKEQVGKQEGLVKDLKKQMEQMKTVLYNKFGDSIQLEMDEGSK